MSAQVQRAYSSLLAREIYYEFLNTWRTPGFTAPTLAFPIMFYLFFGIVFALGGNGWDQSTFMMVTYATFGIIGPALFGFGTVMATERDQGWLRLKLASPMPVSAYFLAKAAMSMLFAAIVVVILFIMAIIGGGVRLEALQWFTLGTLLIVGSLPFCALGLCIGCFARATSAVAIVNLIYLPMGLLSGLWIPLMVFPDFMKYVANLFPAYHLSQIALKIVDMDAGQPVLIHWLVLIGQTGLFLWLAKLGFRRMNPR